MIKILLITENSPYAIGGIERHCRKIMDMYKDNSSVEIDFLCKENIKYKWNKWLNKFVFDYKYLISEIEKSNYDIIHVHGFASMVAYQGLRAAFQLKKKTIYTAHYHPFTSLRRPVFGRLFFHFYIKPYLSKIDTIVAINDEDKSFFQNYNKNIVTIPSSWITGIERSENIKRKKDMILCIARNDDNKGLEHLNKLPFEKFDIHCVTNNRKGIANHINVHLDVDENTLNDLYAQAEVVVIPSKYEAFSIVALEALERGVPVVISNNVRIADHLVDIKGWRIFEYGNDDDFLRKIEKIIGEQVEQDKVIERFSEKAVKKKFDEIYRRF